MWPWRSVGSPRRQRGAVVDLVAHMDGADRRASRCTGRVPMEERRQRIRQRGMLIDHDRLTPVSPVSYYC